MSDTVSGSESSVFLSRESPTNMVPPFLPVGEIIGWNLVSTPNPDAKKNEYTYTVCVQTVGAFSPGPVVAEKQQIVMATCDGPCGNRVPSNHLITLGKCDHSLCKACYGLVKNSDGSYGCSNFYCWADARENFRSEKAAYRQIINKQICRAKKLKREGEDVKTCTEANLPETPFGSGTDGSEKESKKKGKKEKSEKMNVLTASRSTDNINSYGLIKRV